MRIFSHTCSNTEIVCALGAGALLVGVDADSDYPAAIVDPLPKPGRDLDLDIAAVQALKPDLVLTSLTVPGHERIVGELESRGLRTLTLDPQSLEDVYSNIETIAAALHIPDRGADLIRDMRRQMPAVEVSGPRPNVLVEWWPKPVIVPARQSWITDMIHLAGGRNPYAGIDAKSVSLDDIADTAEADRAHAVVMSWCGVQEAKYRPEIVQRREAWHAWPALKNGQIHAITEAWMGRPGPRLVQGYAALRKVIAAL